MQYMGVTAVLDPVDSEEKSTRVQSYEADSVIELIFVASALRCVFPDLLVQLVRPWHDYVRRF
jgi:hypothetical protein